MQTEVLQLIKRFQMHKSIVGITICQPQCFQLRKTCQGGQVLRLESAAFVLDSQFLQFRHGWQGGQTLWIQVVETQAGQGRKCGEMLQTPFRRGACIRAI